jgi:hypothetical protein
MYTKIIIFPHKKKKNSQKMIKNKSIENGTHIYENNMQNKCYHLYLIFNSYMICNQLTVYFIRTEHNFIISN